MGGTAYAGSMADLLLTANAGDGTISVLRLHREPRAHLEVVTTSGELPGCGTLAVDTERGLVFAAYKGDPAGIATLRLDRESGELTEIARREVPGSMTYLSLTDDHCALLGVSYGGGFGAVWPVAGERLGEAQSRFEYRNLHCIVSSGESVYAVSLGEDLIVQFRLVDGALAPLQPSVAAAPTGSGPRHLIIDGANAYLVTEYSGEAIRYDRADDGALTPAESCFVVDPEAGLSHSRFGADPEKEHLIWGADIHRAGDYLLTSERMSSLITTNRLLPGGRLGDVVAFTPGERQPRGFAVSPDGAYAVVVGEKSTHAALFEIDGDGRLHSLDRVPIGAGANWVRFA